MSTLDSVAHQQTQREPLGALVAQLSEYPGFAMIYQISSCEIPPFGAAFLLNNHGNTSIGRLLPGDGKLQFPKYPNPKPEKIKQILFSLYFPPSSFQRSCSLYSWASPRHTNCATAAEIPCLQSVNATQRRVANAQNLHSASPLTKKDLKPVAPKWTVGFVGRCYLWSTAEECANGVLYVGVYGGATLWSGARGLCKENANLLDGGRHFQ